MMKRWEFTGDSKVVSGRTVFQIRALVSFGSVTKGDVGGWIEEERSLPQDGKGWVAKPAVVFKRATNWGGTFRGGTFWGGTFEGGTFEGGTFRGGIFWGGTFRGGIFEASPAMAQRSDGYCFIVHRLENELRVWAGCRDCSWDEALAHWNDNHPRGRESREIIEFLRGQLKWREGGNL